MLLQGSLVSSSHEHSHVAAASTTFERCVSLEKLRTLHVHRDPHRTSIPSCLDAFEQTHLHRSFFIERYANVGLKWTNIFANICSSIWPKCLVHSSATSVSQSMLLRNAHASPIAISRTSHASLIKQVCRREPNCPRLTRMYLSEVGLFDFLHSPYQSISPFPFKSRHVSCQCERRPRRL